MTTAPIPRRPGPPARPPGPPARTAARPRALRRNALDFLGLTLVLLLLLGLITASLYQFWHTNRIFTGVNVAGIPVGGLTRAVAHARLQQELGAYPVPPVNLTFEGQRYAIDPLEVRARVDLLDAVNQAYIVGRTGKVGDRLITQFQSLVGGYTVVPRRIYSTDLLQQAIASVAQQVNRAGKPAVQVGVISTRAESAVTVDQALTLQRLTQSLDRAPAGQPLIVPLVVSETAPEPGIATRSKPKDAPLFSEPLILRSDMGVELALDPAVLSSMIVATNPVQVDDARLRAWLAQMASQIDLPARDARMRFNRATGGINVIQESLVGRKLDVEATAAAVQQALAGNARQAPLAVAEVAPAVDSRRAAEMGIRELVATGSTYFKGSSADRIKNIEVAAAKFDGVVIPPGGIFSFNRIVEDVSAANGFEDSLVIWGDRTAVGIGGGVCQISTTVFRAAYEGGFPIVERYNHGYVVDWYGEPGLDATIFTPSVDFKFRNDTNAYLLIEPVVDSVNGVATFNFYGTSPGRQVTVSKPAISDVKPAPPAVYTVDPSLAPASASRSIGRSGA
jgi:vancomycin resistance protein YoaR